MTSIFLNRKTTSILFNMEYTLKLFKIWRYHNLHTPNQSALGQYGQGHGSHSHDQLGAEAEDAVFPSMGSLLVTNMTSCCGSHTLVWSQTNGHNLLLYGQAYLQLGPRSFSALFYHAKLVAIKIQMNPNILLQFSVSVNVWLSASLLGAPEQAQLEQEGPPGNLHPRAWWLQMCATFWSPPHHTSKWCLLVNTGLGGQGGKWEILWQLKKETKM